MLKARYDQSRSGWRDHPATVKELKARTEGVEPTTSTFVALRSYPLSYVRMRENGYPVLCR